MENVNLNLDRKAHEKMTSEVFSALFEVREDALERVPCREFKGTVEIVDLTTQATQREDPIVEKVERPDVSVALTKPIQPAHPMQEQQTSLSAPGSEFCGHCLLSLTSLNFLAKMQHVKTCAPSGGVTKVVNGRHAMARFLSYYGYEELKDVFADKGIEMDLLEIVDTSGLEQLTGVKLGSRKKFMLALEQYKESGRLQVRNALIGVRDKRRTERKAPSWARSTTTNSAATRGERGEDPKGRAEEEWRAADREPDRREDVGLPVQKRRETGMSSSIDMVLLDSLWDRSDRYIGKRPMVSVSSCELWVSAATCQLRHETLEERLKKAKTDSSGQDQGRDITRQQWQQHSELATKRASLTAMKEELQIQRQTVRELEVMIAEMQADIDADLRR